MNDLGSLSHSFVTDILKSRKRTMKTISKKCRTLVSLLFLLFFSILLIGCRKEQAAETTSPPTENKAWERFGRLRGVQDLDEIYRRAEEGDDSCQLFLGEALFNTGRTQIEKAEGVEWIRKVAEQNNTLAFSLLGSCYAEGCGVEQDYAEAVKWFQKRAADGQSVARFQLALCYIEGKGIEKTKPPVSKSFRSLLNRVLVIQRQKQRHCWPNSVSNPLKTVFRNKPSAAHRKRNRSHLPGWRCS
jgi:hypothetical protein